MGRTRGAGSGGAWPLATVADPLARAWEADDVVWLWRETAGAAGERTPWPCVVLSAAATRGAEIAGSPRAGPSDADEGVLVRPLKSHLKTRRAGGASQEQLEGFAEGFARCCQAVPGDKKFAEAVAEGLELAARRLTVVEGMHFPKVAANALLTLDPEGRGAGAVAVVVDRAGEEIAPCDATALVSIRVLPVAGAPELPGGTKVPRGWLREPPRLSQATAADGGGPGFSHDDHVLTKQDMGGGAGPSQYGAEAQLFERLAANMCTISDIRQVGDHGDDAETGESDASESSEHHAAPTFWYRVHHMQHGETRWVPESDLEPYPVSRTRGAGASPRPSTAVVVARAALPSHAHRWNASTRPVWLPPCYAPAAAAAPARTPSAARKAPAAAGGHPRPPGRAPRGKAWDRAVGVWIDEEDAEEEDWEAAEAAAAAADQCARNPNCVRGYRHGGRGGPCSLKCPPGRGGAKASARSPLTSPALRGGGRGGRGGGAGGRGARGGSGGRGVSFGPGVNDGTERRMIVRRTVNSEARQAAVERQRSDASRAEIEREVRDDGVWREWHSRINGGGAATGGLCVRTCSLQRVIGYLQSVKDGSLAGDDPHFNISYIIRQVMPMHPGPSKDEAYILLQLRAATRAPHPAMGAHAKGWRAAAGSVEAAAGPADAAGVAKFPPQAPAEAGEALGCLAACVRNSRGKAVIEFRAIYVAPQLRNQRVAHVRAARESGPTAASPAHPRSDAPLLLLFQALVHFALDESREQCRQLGWSGEKLARMSAEVTLPHCMQTSARFWERVGFHLGREVDNHEPKMAVLRELQGASDVADGWISRGCTAPVHGR